MIEELDGHVPLRLNSTAKDAAAHYRGVIGAFTETIRLSDFKANVAIVFTGIMMGLVVAFRDKLPSFVPLDLALAPFLLVFLCLLICLYPRYGREGRVHFVIVRNASPKLFPGPDEERHRARKDADALRDPVANPLLEDADAADQLLHLHRHGRRLRGDRALRSLAARALRRIAPLTPR